MTRGLRPLLLKGGGRKDLQLNYGPRNGRGGGGKKDARRGGKEESRNTGEARNSGKPGRFLYQTTNRSTGRVG